MISIETDSFEHCLHGSIYCLFASKLSHVFTCSRLSSLSFLGSIYNLSSDFRIETAKEFIKWKGWAKEGLGMQIHIHEQHEENVNWHTHAYIMHVVTTRRFVLYGKELGEKARDLQANNRGGKVHNNHHEFDDNILLRDAQNGQFKACGMSNRVDLPITQEPIGPVRICSIFNPFSPYHRPKIHSIFRSNCFRAMRAGRCDKVCQNQYIPGLWCISQSTVQYSHNHGGKTRLQRLLRRQIPSCSLQAELVNYMHLLGCFHGSKLQLASTGRESTDTV